MARGRVRFFLDNNLAPKVAHALNRLLEPDHTAEHLREQVRAQYSRRGLDVRPGPRI